MEKEVPDRSGEKLGKGVAILINLRHSEHAFYAANASYANRPPCLNSLRACI